MRPLKSPRIIALIFSASRPASWSAEVAADRSSPYAVLRSCCNAGSSISEFFQGAQGKKGEIIFNRVIRVQFRQPCGQLESGRPVRRCAGKQAEPSGHTGYVQIKRADQALHGDAVPEAEIHAGPV